MFLLAAYNVMLAKYIGEEDIVVGTGVAGRNHADLGNIVGMFVNMLPMRNYPCDFKTFGNFLDEVRESTLDAFENQDYQFNDLVKQLGLHGQLDRNPLFDTILQVQNPELEKLRIKAENDNFKIVPYVIDAAQIHFDIAVDAVETKEGIEISITYSTALFKPSSIERFRDWYVEILEQVTEQPDIKLEDIDVTMDLHNIRVAPLQEDAGDFDF